MTQRGEPMPWPIAQTVARARSALRIVLAMALLITGLSVSSTGCGDDDLFIRGNIPLPTVPPATPTNGSDDEDDEDDEDV